MTISKLTSLGRKIISSPVFLPGVILFIAFCLGIYHLDQSPRPWHDEGAALSLAKTLAGEGVYASRNLDELQTFGPIQSVGPTVILPVALSFRTLGVSLFNGRIVALFYLVVAILAFFLLSRKFYGDLTAVLAVALLISSAAARIFYHGRQAVGEVPALGFLLLGCLLIGSGLEKKKTGYLVAAGSLFGLAMITKSTYTVFLFATLFALFIFDLLFGRRAHFTRYLVISLAALAWIAGWQIWQYAYFGADVMSENASKFALLTNAATGFDLKTSLLSVKFLFGPDSGYFHFFWGIPALLFGLLVGWQTYQKSFLPLLLAVFGSLWLGYYLLWSKPWLSYVFVPAAVASIFVAKLWVDLFQRVRATPQLTPVKIGRLAFQLDYGLLALLGVVGLTVFYQFQLLARRDILPSDPLTAAVVAEIQAKIEPGLVIETWERELDILTERRYHYPDQSMLAYVHKRIYRGGADDYALGEAYFQQYRPAYVILGWFGRWTQIYDLDYLAEHSQLIASVGAGEERYDIYQVIR